MTTHDKTAIVTGAGTEHRQSSRSQPCCRMDTGRGVSRAGASDPSMR